MPWDGGTRMCPADAHLEVCFTFDDLAFTNGGQATLSVAASAIAPTTGRDQTPAILVENTSTIMVAPTAATSITVAAIELQVQLASEPDATQRMGLLDSSSAPSLAMFYWNGANPDVDAGSGPSGHFLSCALGTAQRLFTATDTPLGTGWHTIACNCADNTLTIYLDGALAGSETGCSPGLFD